MKTLIVEDEKSSQLILEDYLYDFGKSVVVDTGEQAIKAFREALETQNPFDLVTLDIMLPDMDGYGVLNAIRQVEQDKAIAPENAVKIIMTSALDDMQNIMDAFDQKAEVYIVKPVMRNMLLGTLRDLKLITEP